jgi:hypothetical protein
MKPSDEHEYYEDIPPEELYGDDNPPEEFNEKSFIPMTTTPPKTSEEVFNTSEILKTMDLKFINGRLHQKFQEHVYTIGVESGYIYNEHSTEIWREVPSETA